MDWAAEFNNVQTVPYSAEYVEEVKYERKVVEANKQFDKFDSQRKIAVNVLKFDNIIVVFYISGN